MTKEQLLKEVSEKIIKVVPEIRELKFGCYVDLGFTDSYHKVIQQTVSYIRTLDYIQDCEDEIIEFGQYKKEKIVEIIGRTITLEDVLRALGYKAGDYRIYAEGFIRFFREESLMFDWLLGQPLYNQSIETLMALNKIL